MLAALYDDDARFRSRVIMQRHNYGRGEYKYLAYPLPDPVAALRASLYPPLAAIANEWRATLGEAGRFPPTLEAFLAECHAAGQTRPTPLLLRYGTGRFQLPAPGPLRPAGVSAAAHRAAERAGQGFPRRRIRAGRTTAARPVAAAVVPLAQGEAVIFPVHHRPVQGTRGAHRVTMRHGVSRVTSGMRQTLGIIFHDAA